MNPRILADGADGYELRSLENELLGWVRGRAIGVCGFSDEASSVDAAIASYRALRQWLVRNAHPPLRSVSAARPAITHDGAHRWVLIDRVHVARLITMGTHDGPTPVRHAYEIVLRGEVSDATAIQAALVALRAGRPATAPSAASRGASVARLCAEADAFHEGRTDPPQAW